MTCLLVTANVATLSGDVTRARPPGVFVGIQSFILSATDEGSVDAVVGGRINVKSSSSCQLSVGMSA